jgi:putative ABC transport system permease protein
MMNILSQLWLRLLSLMRRGRLEREMEEEMRFHLEMQIEQNLGAGMAAEDAHYAARRQFGNQTWLKEVSREMWSLNSIETLIQDLRYGARTLMKSPGFAFAAVLTLALGIGANTAIFSVVNAVLIRSLPFTEPDRLVVLMENYRRVERMSASYPNFKDWRERAKSFEAMAGFRAESFTLTGVDKAVRLQGRRVNWNLLPMLGVKPQLGRMFTEQDDQPGASATALMSHGLWQERFGGDPGVVGKTLMINGHGASIIGVLPADFEFFRRDDLYMPFGLVLTPQSNWLNRGNHFGLNVLARLTPGVTEAQARVEMETIAAQLEREYPDPNSGNGAMVQSLAYRYAEDLRDELLVLQVAVGFVLLLACANVANLLLARASERQREVAMRLALGAGRWRIVRQLLSESMLLSALGGLAGLLIGVWLTKGLLALASADVPRLNQAGLDSAALLFTAGVSVLTGLLFGVLPALQAVRTDLNTILKEGGRRGGGSAREGGRKTLLVVQVAVSLVLLIGAGLMLRTVYQLTRVDPGFNAENLLTMRFQMSGQAYTAERQQVFYRECLERVSALPGVRAATLTLSTPMDVSNWNSVFIVADKPAPPRAELPAAAFTPVSANYFEAMGIQLIKGRWFTDSDTADKPRLTVINETLARQLWPGEDPIGKRLKQGFPEDQPPWREVIGVVADVKLEGVDQETPMQSYLPLAQEPTGSLGLLVRTVGPPLALAATVERAIQAIDKDLPVFNVQSMDQLLGNDIAQQRLTMALLAGFAVLALLLAAVGIYGVIAYSVSQRTHEIGIRIALGARNGDVLRLVLWQGMRLALIGVALGLGASFALTRLMKTLLYGVEATDPMTFVALSLLLGLVALLACWIPARRAASMDPLEALRVE